MNGTGRSEVRMVSYIVIGRNEAANNARHFCYVSPTSLSKVKHKKWSM